MKLYMKPGACSLAPHIALREAGLPFELIKVDLARKRTEDGRDFLEVNPKGQVPALVLDDGPVLTENAVILQYLADRAPEAGLLPPAGSLARYRTLEWVNLAATELHKGFSPLFRTNTPEAYRQILIETLHARLALLDQRLSEGPYLAGDDFTIADAYAFTVARWAKPMGIDLAAWAELPPYMERVAGRPAVRDALAAEGLA
jgi:glutathione S-transferase